MKKRYIGIDLHRDCFTACIRYENGKEAIREWKLAQLPAWAKKLKQSDEVAVEVTGNTRLFYEAIAGRVERVVVVNPKQFRVISESVKKTDSNDARMLALFLSKDMLPEVRMKDKALVEIASLAQTRDMLVKLRTALKNKINNTLSAQGINLKKEALGSDRKLEQILDLNLTGSAMLELRIVIQQIRNLNQSVRELETAIGERARQVKGHRNLTSIKGIGELGSGILLSVIGNVDDFPDEGKLSAYFGIVPRVEKSNRTERIGRITCQGNKLGRTALIQCALIAKRYSPYLARYFDRIQKRRGSGKAIIALARKFLGIVYRTLKNEWVFDDFTTFTLATP